VCSEETEAVGKRKPLTLPGRTGGKKEGLIVRAAKSAVFRRVKLSGNPARGRWDEKGSEGLVY